MLYIDERVKPMLSQPRRPTPISWVGQTQRAPRPIDQLRAEPFRQRADLLAERGLSDVQPLGRAAEIEFFRQDHKAL
jgi:hypothetical protein